ncbi:DUF2789 domain-containing protein [Thalassotalea sp. G2M2-11]|uniref:DUF2789 domain-containing protein n=1 Tax=Thalassotalea sp. G2M2-11 TaxID=2787627 RepID=UPI0019CF4EAB|nr:DUF2789 domain-containing protein [Thalassotalea sp. G2M2-11]
MDRSSHTLACLFSQIGLDSEAQAIKTFIRKHRGIPADVSLANANFWNESQSAFITEALQDDSDWAEVVDTLDALLREED